MSSIEYSNSLTISSGSNGDIVFNPHGTGALKVGANEVLNASKIGVSVQAYNADLQSIADLSPSDNQILKYSGGAWTASSDSDVVHSVDDSTLQQVSNVYSIKDAGVTSAKLASDCVDGSKIADSSINSEHIASGAIDAVHVSSEIPTIAGSNTFTNALNVFKGITASEQVSFQKSGASGYKYEVQNEVQTTDDTQTAVHSFTLQDNAVTNVKATVLCCNADGSEVASYEVKAVYKRVSGTSSLLSSSVVTNHESSAGLDASVDLSSNDSRVLVQGLASNNIRWNASIVVNASPLYSA